MSAPPSGQSTLVYSLATLLRNSGDSVLDGTSTLTLQAGGLQHLTRLFEQYLLSRTHQHGFLALPSHPADTDSLLQVQFLFDMLQKTVSLKLINPAGSRLQSVVKIFPFKSLKYLELKRVPPHCLEGLRSVYSQLEAFTCSKSLSSLEELLSLCGGDLSSALPWLELHTLNFSYNSIVSLDDSLSLLNVLKSLDLSHNRIQDCAEFLLPLSELQHLNFGYNFLQRVPQLGLSGRAKLLTLILRNNELETINGVEHLSCLQHLDLAFNILMEHSQLAPLSMLHCLKTLNLEGNPLYFQKTHRTSTVRHLSPKAALLPLKLDDSTLSSSELAVLPRPGQMIIHAGQTVAAVVLERGTQEVSSGGGELSDSLSMSEPGVTRLHRKKSRSKVKVRRASISEPSDTDYEPKRNSVLQDIVLPHQEDIKRMDLFRHQLGEDWLRYQHHLEGAQEGALAPGMPNGRCDNAGSRTPPLGTHAVPLLTSEPKEEDLDLETESTLQWPGHSPENTESTLETSMGLLEAREIHGEEEEDLEVDLCLPLLVGTITEEEEGGDVKKDTRPLFLRVKPGHALEVDMQTGRVLARLELDSLREVSTSQTTWTEKEGEKVLPVLELHFCYISRARRRRRYVILDDSPQQALQALSDVLSRVAEENEHRVSEGQPECARLQCLRCRTEFSQQGAERVTDPNPQGKEEEEEEKMETRGDTAASCVRGLICPGCSSDHVVQLSTQLPPPCSTPVPCPLEGDRALQCFAFDSLDTPTCGHQESLVDGVLSAYGSAETQGSVNEGAELSDAFHTAKNGTFYIGDENSWSDRHPSDLAGFHTPDRDNGEAAPPVVGKDELAASWNYNYSAPQLLQLLPETPQGSSPGRLDLLSKDGEAVDHRLKLFLDVEVFQEDSEEIHGFLKMSAVKFGDPVEFPALLVVSDQYIYILEITSEAQGQPSDWLRKRNCHRLAELRFLEVGLGSQSIHMEFVDSGAAYTLLVRDPVRCKCFFELLTGLVRELAPKLDSKLESISTTRLNPQHPLWPLVFESTQSDAAEDRQLLFFYLLAFVQQDDRLTPVTVLATEETLHLLDEDHQWSRSSLNAASNGDRALCGGRVTVQESQPISCVSSLHLFSSDACRVDIKLYDEMVKEERVWALQTESMELVQDLVAWVRNHWEDMFGVKLAISLQESGS